MLTLLLRTSKALLGWVLNGCIKCVGPTHWSSWLGLTEIVVHEHGEAQV